MHEYFVRLHEQLEEAEQRILQSEAKVAVLQRMVEEMRTHETRVQRLGGRVPGKLAGQEE